MRNPTSKLHPIRQRLAPLVFPTMCNRFMFLMLCLFFLVMHGHLWGITIDCKKLIHVLMFCHWEGRPSSYACERLKSYKFSCHYVLVSFWVLKERPPRANKVVSLQWNELSCELYFEKLEKRFRWTAVCLIPFDLLESGTEPKLYALMLLWRSSGQEEDPTKSV